MIGATETAVGKPVAFEMLQDNSTVSFREVFCATVAYERTSEIFLLSKTGLLS